MLRVFQRKDGFTLIELLMVIAVIGMLAAVIVTAVGRARIKAYDKKMLQEIKSLRIALDLYYDKYGSYPQTGGTFQCTSGTGSNSCIAGVSALQVLITEGFIPKLPVAYGADANGVDEREIFYGAPGWWNSSWGYQIQFQVSTRDDTLGECNGTCPSVWNNTYVYSVHP